MQRGSINAIRAIGLLVLCGCPLRPSSGGSAVELREARSAAPEWDDLGGVRKRDQAWISLNVDADSLLVTPVQGSTAVFVTDALQCMWPRSEMREVGDGNGRRSAVVADLSTGVASLQGCLMGKGSDDLYLWGDADGLAVSVPGGERVRVVGAGGGDDWEGGTEWVACGKEIIAVETTAGVSSAHRIDLQTGRVVGSLSGIGFVEELGESGWCAAYPAETSDGPRGPEERWPSVGPVKQANVESGPFGVAVGVRLIDGIGHVLEVPAGGYYIVPVAGGRAFVLGEA